LIFGRKPFAFVEDELLLDGQSLALSGLRDRHDELRGPPALDDLLCRLPLVIKFPVTRRVLVRRVEDRTFEE
jgi:hypothetical protein